MFVKHLVWFVIEYGSLSVWSFQEMEYNQYATKYAYQQHMQNGGEKSKKNPLVQIYQHRYQIIQHQFKEMEKKTRLDNEALNAENNINNEV